MEDDLYELWLHIPPGERPPDHYAMLGLPRFYDDHAAIERATADRLETLDRYALNVDPARRAACQRMMNEVARARMVLVDRQRRAAYDTTLPQPPSLEPAASIADYQEPAGDESLSADYRELDADVEPVTACQDTEIRFVCGNCGELIDAAASYAGRNANCPECGANIIVPYLPPEPAEPPVDYQEPDADVEPVAVEQDNNVVVASTIPDAAPTIQQLPTPFPQRNRTPNRSNSRLDFFDLAKWRQFRFKRRHISLAIRAVAVVTAITLVISRCDNDQRRRARIERHLAAGEFAEARARVVSIRDPALSKELIARIDVAEAFGMSAYMRGCDLARQNNVRLSADQQARLVAFLTAPVQTPAEMRLPFISFHNNIANAPNYVSNYAASMDLRSEQRRISLQAAIPLIDDASPLLEALNEEDVVERSRREAEAEVAKSSATADAAAKAQIPEDSAKTVPPLQLVASQGDGLEVPAAIALALGSDREGLFRLYDHLGGQFGAPGGHGVGPKGPVFSYGGNAHQIIFLCDATRSMLSKIDSLKDELARAVAGLNPIQSFDIVFYQDEKVVMFQNGMVNATPENKRKARAFLEGVGVDGAVDPIRALEFCLKLHPQLLYFLTDAADFPDPKAITDTINKYNKDRSIHINTILFVEDKSEHEKKQDSEGLMKGIANDNGGRFRWVEIDAFQH